MSRRAIPWLVILFLGLRGGQPALGQDAATDGTTDLEGWASVELKYKLGRRWMFSGEEQVRLKSDISEVDLHFSQFGVQYDTRQGVSFDGGIRFIRRNDTQGNIQGYESQRRYHVSASYEHDPGRFSLDYRVRYQAKEDVGADDDPAADRHLRFRVQAGYDFRDWKLDPVFSTELFRPLGDTADAAFDKVRYTLGTDWDAWGDSSVGVFYRLEKELGVDSPRTSHIVGLSFTYVLGRD